MKYHVEGYWDGDTGVWDYGLFDTWQEAKQRVLADLDDPTPADRYVVTLVIEERLVTYDRRQAVWE